MDKNYKWKALGIIALVVFSLWKIYPVQESVKLGLDLQGGMQMLLQVEMDKVPAEQREDLTERAAEIIRNRIDEFGVVEPDISTQGVDQVVVKLPGITDRKRAIEIVGKTAHLEFKLVSEDNNLLDRALAGNVPTGYELKKTKAGAQEETFLLESEALLTGEHLTNASVGFDTYGQSMVQLSMDGEGAKIFDKVTFQNIGRRLAIVLDGVVHSAPSIRDRIPSGNAQITGSFTPEQASDLALVLRAGALPAPVKIIEERTVGPSLGKDSVEKGVRAGVLGLILILIFMPLYFFRAGIIADMSLFLYIIFVLGAFTGFGATLTLPGIAGFILSVGMAVDANVLIFERIREEIKTGKTSRAAISSGYHKALSAILDANVTTLITSLILFIFGTGPVQGFAVTLSIGIVASLISALIVTRLIFDSLTKRKPDVSLKMLEIVKSPNIPFLKGRFLAYGFSAIVLGLGIAGFFMKSDKTFGVEFTGGTYAQVQFKESVQIADLRNALSSGGIGSFTLQTIGNSAENQYSIKFSGSGTESIEKAFNQVTTNYEIVRVDQIGPSVSENLQEKALTAIFVSCLAIMLYLWIRFKKWQFALAAVIALIHDTIFTFGIYVLAGREINLPIIAALLTVMGYSVNDTIVTFDRIRDNMKSHRRDDLQSIFDMSINQTLSRTILTSATTLLAAGSLFIFGGAGINDFAFVLIIGFLVGTYSSIFVATASALDLKPKR